MGEKKSANKTEKGLQVREKSKTNVCGHLENQDLKKMC